jgi:hypothetical protein
MDHILARTLWGEARGEGRAGLEAVAAVVRNRAARGGWWGATLEEVCLKPWQFSCWNANDPNKAKLETVTSADKVFRLCLEIEAGLSTIVDSTGSADSYFDRRMPVPPKWAQGETPTATIGNHVFYRLRKS